MKTNLPRLLVTAFAVLGIGLSIAMPFQAYAADGLTCNILWQGFCDAATGPSSGKADSSNSGIYMVLQWALAILTAGVGVVAVAAFVYAGIMYSSADNKPDQVKKAKDIITQTTIGLVVFAAMALVLAWLIPGGIF